MSFISNLDLKSRFFLSLERPEAVAGVAAAQSQRHGKNVQQMWEVHHCKRITYSRTPAPLLMSASSIKSDEN